MKKNPNDMRWGIGLRPHHFSDLHNLEELPILEIMADNLMGHRGGPALAHTDRLAERTSMLLHSVGLNLGSESPLDLPYLHDLRNLMDRFAPQVISDHLCFTRLPGASTFDLLPVPRTFRNLDHVCKRIDFVQNFLNHQIAVENISAYVEYRESEMSEGEFFTSIEERTGCGILLDTNNLLVNCRNFRIDPETELMKFPLKAVKQIHVAGHSQEMDCLFDTHDQPITLELARLTRLLLAELSEPNIPLVLEWDDVGMSYQDLSYQMARCRHMVEQGVAPP